MVRRARFEHCGLHAAGDVTAKRIQGRARKILERGQVDAGF
jgi:hypothetical protein